MRLAWEGRGDTVVQFKVQVCEQSRLLGQVPRAGPETHAR
jgi:hypothetical protein